MITILNILLVVLIFVAGCLFWQVAQQRKQLRELHDEAKQLKQAFKIDRSNQSQDDIKMLIAIEVTNAFELAKRESKMAKYVVNLVPDLIKDIVYKQVIVNMKEELAREGVENKISIIYR